VRVYYASKAATLGIHSNVRETAKFLKTDLSAKTATNDVEIEFVGAMELITKSRQPKTRRRSLSCHTLISSDSGDSLVCLVTIDALMQFLRDEKGQLVRSLFDANVRDFLGKAEVNEAIKTTLCSLDAGDFWWFNSGITIVASALARSKGQDTRFVGPSFG